VGKTWYSVTFSTESFGGWITSKLWYVCAHLTIDTLLTAQGDIAVQFNSGAASLPWAAVRFVLQVSMNDQKYLENMIEGIQTVVEMIATYAVVETLYLDQEFDLQDQIRNKVVGLYVHILGFLGEGVEYYQQSLLSKFWSINLVQKLISARTHCARCVPYVGKRTPATDSNT
jgi:hypothetical protein